MTRDDDTTQECLMVMVPTQYILKTYQSSAHSDLSGRAQHPGDARRLSEKGKQGHFQFVLRWCHG